MRDLWCSPAGLSTIALVSVGVLVLGALPVPAHDGTEVDGPEAFSPSLSLFPEHKEVVAHLDALADHPWMSVHDLGESPEGREIKVVEVVDPESPVPLDERAVTLLLTQQHGNEPAGTPAVLRLLDEIKEGKEIAKSLSDQVLLVLPMVNPDGSDAGTRGNSDGVDVNRDHVHLETEEGETFHRILTNWTVHVALDHHEYGGTGLGNPVPVRVYDYDLTTLVPTHAGVHPMVDTMAKDLMYEGIWPLVQEEGYSVNEYGEVTAAGQPLGHLAGGPDPGILRNHLGIHHIAGILIETRIDAYENPFHDAARREEIQYLTMVATLQYVSEHSGLFVAMHEQAKADHARAPPGWYDEGYYPFLTSDPLADGGSKRQEIPEAYLLKEGPEAMRDLLVSHGLPPGVFTQEGLVHNLDHGLPVHAAAMFSDASARQVIEGVATDPVAKDVNATGEGQDVAETLPGPSMVVFLLVLTGTAGRLLRRRG